jgi:hypothetical protein
LIGLTSTLFSIPLFHFPFFLLIDTQTERDPSGLLLKSLPPPNTRTEEAGRDAACCLPSNARTVPMDAHDKKTPADLDANTVKV